MARILKDATELFESIIRGGVYTKKRIQNTCRTCGKKIPSGLSKCLACTLNLKSGNRRGTCKCQVCGTAVKHQDKICTTCGTNFMADELIGPGHEGDSEEWICLICGKPVDKKARRCDFCGTVFVDDVEDFEGPIVERLSDGFTGHRARPSPG